jgi:predicted transcriptional regulator
MNKNYGKPVKVQKIEAPKADSVECAVNSLSPKEYTLQRRIDSYLKAKKENMVHSFDVISLKKDLQRMINSYGNAVNNKKRNPLSKKLGYYYAIMMDIEGKSKRPVNKARKINKSQADRK